MKVGCDAPRGPVVFPPIRDCPGATCPTASNGIHEIVRLGRSPRVTSRHTARRAVRSRADSGRGVRIPAGERGGYDPHSFEPAPIGDRGRLLA